MHLERLEIENFRRIKYADIRFDGATFLIGPNNTGKSSVIAAVEALLSLERAGLTISDIRQREDGTREEKAVLTGYISGISQEVAASRGFKGRVVDGRFVYRKTLLLAQAKPLIETREYPFKLKDSFSKTKTVGDLIGSGIDRTVIKETFEVEDDAAKLPKGWERMLPEVLDFDLTAEPVWVQNPGGIPQNVLSRLPRLLHIPAITDATEIESGEKTHILGECLSLLFEDLLKGNPLALEIQKGLDELEKQMDPADENTLVSGLVHEVFPECGIRVEPSLQNLLQVLKPKYEVRLCSNVETEVARQGTGLLRTCVFAMLRYHAKLKQTKDIETRSAIVAFEEPELYLHPSAANLLRDTIYELGRSDQIVCSTHSPWMIDLTRSTQSLIRMRIDSDGSAAAVNYGVSAELESLQADDKDRVKMLQLFDDELSRVFFADHVVVVEGDSEVIALKETLRLLPPETQRRVQACFQVSKARGKPSIISLVRYLKALDVNPRVMHDSDTGVEGAEVFNAPIAAVCDPSFLVVLNRNLEEVLDYSPPSKDKPFHVYERTSAWRGTSDIPQAWKVAVARLFDLEWPSDSGAKPGQVSTE